MGFYIIEINLVLYFDWLDPNTRVDIGKSLPLNLHLHTPTPTPAQTSCKVVINRSTMLNRLRNFCNSLVVMLRLTLF